MSSHQYSSANPGLPLPSERAGEQGACSLPCVILSLGCNDSALQHLDFQLLYLSTAFHHLEKWWGERRAAGRAGVGLAANPPCWSGTNAASLPLIPCFHVLTLGVRLALATIRLGAAVRVHVAVNISVCYSPRSLWDASLFSRHTETLWRESPALKHGWTWLNRRHAWRTIEEGYCKCNWHQTWVSQATPTQTLIGDSPVQLDTVLLFMPEDIFSLLWIIFLLMDNLC